jgi:hypothetical protein
MNVSDARTVVVQGGGFGEHRFESVAQDARIQQLNSRTFTVRLEPGAGAKIVLMMRRFVEAPTITKPWERN